VQLSYFVRDNVGSPSNVAQVTVEVLKSAWQNPTLNLDVNDDGHISPIDALLVINYLNTGGPSKLPDTQPAPPYLDPSGDENASAIDVLLIINYLNSHPSGEGEAEGEGQVSAYSQLAAPLIVTMVTPEQMLATVGGQIVHELETAIASELDSASQWHDDDDSQLVTDWAEKVWDEDETAAALVDLTLKRNRAQDAQEVDSYFGTL
jgi:hypothetical protein